MKVGTTVASRCSCQSSKAPHRRGRRGRKALDGYYTSFSASLVLNSGRQPTKSRAISVLINVIVNDSLDTVLEQVDIEVDDQTEGDAGETLVGEQLRDVDGEEALDTLDFDNHTPLDQEVEHEGALHGEFPVRQRQWFFDLNVEPQLEEFLPEARRVDGFEQAWTKPPVNINGTPNHLLCDTICVRHVDAARIECARENCSKSRESASEVLQFLRVDWSLRSQIVPVTWEKRGRP